MEAGFYPGLVMTVPLDSNKEAAPGEPTDGFEGAPFRLFFEGKNLTEESYGDFLDTYKK